MFEGWSHVLVLGLAGLAVGTMIGGTGIGGVLLAPALDLFGTRSVHDAVPICMVAFIFAGLAGTVLHARRNAVRWSSLGPLSLGACPAAFLGAAVIGHIPATALKLAIAGMVIGAGVQALVAQRTARRQESVLRAGSLICLGAVVGFGSSLTGSGGPLILLPILLLAGANLPYSVGLAQAIQIPIGIFATISNLAFGQVDLSLAAWVTVAVVAGVCIGVQLAHRQSTETVKGWVAIMLVVSGVFYASSTLAG